MSALAPGLYRATVRGVADTTILVNDEEMGGGFTLGMVAGARYHDGQYVTDARPLIVLDISTWFPHRAAAAIQAVGRSPLDPGHAAFMIDVLEQIEAQSKPARIDEPGLWGVVEASRRELTGRPRIIDTEGNWFKVSNTTGSCVWVHESSEYTANWTDLIDPVLIRDGVTS